MKEKGAHLKFKEQVLMSMKTQKNGKNFILSWYKREIDNV